MPQNFQTSMFGMHSTGMLSNPISQAWGFNTSTNIPSSDSVAFHTLNRRCNVPMLLCTERNVASKGVHHPRAELLGVPSHQDMP